MIMKFTHLNISVNYVLKTYPLENIFKEKNVLEEQNLKKLFQNENFR